jgi:hypothetical protein
MVAKLSDILRQLEHIIAELDLGDHLLIGAHLSHVIDLVRDEVERSSDDSPSNPVEY